MNANHVYRITIIMPNRDYPIGAYKGTVAERVYEDTVRQYRGCEVKLFDMTEGKRVK